MPSPVPAFARNPFRAASLQLQRASLLLCVVGGFVLFAFDGDAVIALGTSLLTGGILGQVLLRQQVAFDQAMILDGRSDALALAGKDLTGASFTHWHLIPYVYFRGRTVDYACFYDSTFAAAGNFVDASARHTDFRKAHVGDRSVWRRCDLTGADFTGAELREADFTAATIEGTNFDGADLTGANFTGAVGTASFAGAQVDQATLPPS